MIDGGGLRPVTTRRANAYRLRCPAAGVDPRKAPESSPARSVRAGWAASQASAIAATGAPVSSRTIERREHLEAVAFVEALRRAGAHAGQVAACRPVTRRNGDPARDAQILQRAFEFAALHHIVFGLQDCVLRRSAVKFDAPIARTLPAFARRSNASATSSWLCDASSAWARDRSIVSTLSRFRGASQASAMRQGANPVPPAPSREPTYVVTIMSRR